MSPPAGDRPDTVVGYVRSASDVLRLAVFGLAALVLAGLTRWAQDAIVGVEVDLIALLGGLPTAVARVLAGVAQVVVVVAAVVVYLPALAQRRFRLVGYVLTGNALTAALVAGVTWWLDRADLRSVVNEVAARDGLRDHAIEPRVLAQLACSFVILGPFVSGRWRRTGAVTLVGLVAVRLLVADHLPAELFVTLALGATAGCGVLLLYGRPDRRPRPGAVRDALVASGHDVADLVVASVDARGSTPYLATMADGSHLFAKALSPEERSADLLFRAYRLLRLRDVGDERPFSTLRRTVEHEAMVSLLARDGGVRTPRIRAVAQVGEESMLLALDLIDGRSLDRIEPDAVDDALLVRLWEQVATLRALRIAHRDLRRANVFVDADGEPWIIDFGFSEVAASDRLLAADVAQLLVALALAVGAERSVAAAVAVLGPEAVGSAHPLLQPAALSGATRSALAEHGDLLEELRTEVADSAPDAPQDLASLDRVSRRTVFTVATLGLATYFLLPQLADVADIVDRVSSADWWWFPPVLVASALSYTGAAVGLIGSTSVRLPFRPTLLAQVGSSFASKLAPAGLGGMALNTRYLQRSGAEATAAVTSVGLNAIAGTVVHVSLLVTFAVWAGADAFGSVRLPEPRVALAGAGAVAVITAVALAVGRVRAQLRERLLPVLGRGAAEVVTVLRRPGRLALLLGGSSAVTASYVAALAFAVQAFGGSDLSVAQIGAVYLAGAAVASAAPTPGGLGALEAAVIAGLVAAGMENSVAVPAVFLYRLATFWVPIVPGWASFTYLQRRDYI